MAGELALDTVLVVRMQKWNNLGAWKGGLVVIGTSGRVTFSPNREAFIQQIKLLHYQLAPISTIS